MGELVLTPPPPAAPPTAPLTARAIARSGSRGTAAAHAALDPRDPLGSPAPSVVRGSAVARNPLAEREPSCAGAARGARSARVVRPRAGRASPDSPGRDRGAGRRVRGVAALGLGVVLLLGASCGDGDRGGEGGARRGASAAGREPARAATLHPFGGVDVPFARQVPLDGTDVRLPLPEGFVSVERGSRLRHETLGCSVTVRELDQPFDEVAAAFEAGTWPENRLYKATELPSAVPEFEQDGRPAFHLVFRYPDQPYSEWMLVTGDADGVLVVLASAANEDVTGCRDALFAILRGARWDRGRERDPFDGQLFRLDPPPDLSLVRRSDGRVVLGTPGDEQGPWMHVEAVAPARSGGELEQLAEERLGLPQTIRTIQVRERRPVERDGLHGYELEAEAVHKRSGEPMLVHLLALYDPERDHVISVRATVSAARAATWLPAFQEATASLRRTPVP